MGYMSVVVLIDDVNEPPEMLAQTREVLENSPLDTKVGNKIVFEDVDFGQSHEFFIVSGTHNAQNIFKIEHGARCAQLVIAPITQANLNVVLTLDATQRGHGGFGSTDQKV